MSAAAHDPGSSESSSGYEDGLGRRVLAIDRETGDMREGLRLRPELRIFGRALQERLPLVAGLEDERFARPRAVEPDVDGRLTVISEFVAGRRLSDILDAAADQGIVAGLDAGLGLLLELLPALSRLHDAGIAHGALGPGRLMITAAGQIVLLDAIYGEALERLQLTRKRLWAELRLAFPSTAGSPRFDKAADLTQAALTAASLIVGRTFRDDEYPEGLAALRQEIVEIASIRASKAFADGVEKFFAATLPLPTRKTALASADEAAIDLRKLLRKDVGITTCRNAMADFFEQVDTAEKDRATAAAADYARQEAGRADLERQEEERLALERIEREQLDAEIREQARLEAERALRDEAQRRAREEWERQAREDAERRAREQAEREAREQAERREREEAERRAREEADRRARAEAERKAREDADRRAREEADRKAREEADRRAREEAQRKAREEAERKARAEAERKAREDAERRAREEAERRAREEAERKAREEAERRAREEAERKAREEAERKARVRLEAERKVREEAERKVREEAERKTREEAERKARAEAERKAREEAERKARAEAERKAREEAARKERERTERDTRERIERARVEAERVERERIEAERRQRERVEQETRERIERARVEAERAERERIEEERAEREQIDRERAERERLERDRIDRERTERERLERERTERERLDAERRERERLETERRERERAERAAREREQRERAAAAANAPAAGGGWLVPPDRAAAFEPVVDDTPPPPPPTSAYPVYAPSAETESWTPELEPPAAIEIAPVAASAPPPVPAIRLQSSARAGIRLKDEPKPPPRGPARADSRNEPDQISAVGAYEPFSHYMEEERPIPWKLIAAGIVLIAATFGIAKGFLPSEIASPPLKKSAEAKKAEPPPAALTAPGSVSITTDPPGVRVLVDGKIMGTSPLTLDKLAPGRHVLTLQGPGGSIRRTIRVEPGQGLAIDIPVFSGFVEIAAPFIVEVAEGGKVIGTSDNPIILGPGRHTLHLQNKDLNYSATQAVDIEPGETARLPIDPRGHANINAVPWAEVFIDGQKAGDTPLANVAIRLGLREIVFKNPNFPERKIVTTIKAGEPATITLDFNKDK